MSDKLPVVNAWTEFGQLEYICVGSAAGAHDPSNDPCYSYVKEKNYAGGARPAHVLKEAEAQLQNLVDVLEGEQVIIGSVKELDKQLKQELQLKKTFLTPPTNVKEDKRINKLSAGTCRPPKGRFNHG